MSSASAITLSSMQSKPTVEKWLFTEEQLENTPSRREKVLPAKELNYRQQAANLIQDMGQRLPVNQLTINTAIVYMHRFYMFHSFPTFSRFVIAPTALFLAAKVEEQPRKLEHVIRVCHSCLYPDKPSLDVHSDDYLKQAQQLVEHELILLQTLGFDISIDHPHTHVVKCTQLVKASRDLSQMAYFMATNSLHLTTFCLKYKPTVVSAMCIHLSCKWSNYEIPLSSEGKAYWYYMDSTITEAMLENIISEFLKILDLCPTRLRKLKNYRPSSRDGPGGSTPQSKDSHPKVPANKASSGNNSSNRPTDSRRPMEATTAIDQKRASTSLTIAEYKHKRERELQQSSQKLASRPETSKASQNPMNAGHSIGKPSNRPEPRSSQNVTKAGHSIGKPSNRPESRSSQNVTKDGQHVKYSEKPSHNPENHKRSDRLIVDAKVNHATGIPGLQKPKHLSSHSLHHHATHAKDPSRHLSKHASVSDAKSAARPHNHVPMTRPKGNHSADSNKISTSQHAVKSAESGTNIVAGMEQKVLEQMNALRSKEVPKPSQVLPFAKAEHPISQTNIKEHKNKHSISQSSAHTDNASSQSTLPKTYEGLYEMYKKTPDMLRHLLKQKAQSTPLSQEENRIRHKLKKKEEERQRRKREYEKQRVGKSHSGHNASQGGQPDPVMPSGGPLTVRIKLPSSARTEALKVDMSSGGGQQMTANSGSDVGCVSSPSTSATKSGKKRSHTHDLSGLSAPVAAKHSKKSVMHHQQSHDQNKHRHKANKSASHHHSKHQVSHNTIDEATFQQALSSLTTMVQTGQTVVPAGSDRIVPTVTLKRAEAQNGGRAGGYVAHSSKEEKFRFAARGKQLGFDPSAPVPANPPENLFGGTESEMPARISHAFNERGPDVSSPEMGEIVDDEDEDVPPRHASLDYNSNNINRQNFNQSGASNHRSYNHSHGNNYTKPDPRKIDGNSLSNVNKRV